MNEVRRHCGSWPDYEYVMRATTDWTKSDWVCSSLVQLVLTVEIQIFCVWSFFLCPFCHSEEFWGHLIFFSWQRTAERWQEITLSEDLAVDGGLLNPLATSPPAVCGVNQLSPFSSIKIFQTCLVLLIRIMTIRHHEKQNCKWKRYLQCAVGSSDFLIHFRF